MTFTDADKPIDWLRPNPRNARTHSDDQIGKIAALIDRYGWTTRILVAPDGQIVAGHGRWAAAKRLGVATVPVRIVDGWSDEDIRLYCLADNKVALAAGWDDELLAIELGELSASGADLDLAGFEAGELAALLGPAEAAIDGAALRRVETSRVADVFWIQITGPLADQAAALTALRGVMDQFPAVTVKLGTTPRDGSDG
jgi:ParB-like chromosome segregation protein Spo0J